MAKKKKKKKAKKCTSSASKPAAKPSTGPRMTAEDMAGQQREISVAEFFTKNRHLLGFDNLSRALLTTVKEAVDNAIDAAEEAGYLPEVIVRIEQRGETRFFVSIEDNGPHTRCPRQQRQHTHFPQYYTCP